MTELVLSGTHTPEDSQLREGSVPNHSGLRAGSNPVVS
jgi:hypothetical protein